MTWKGPGSGRSCILLSALNSTAWRKEQLKRPVVELSPVFRTAAAAGGSVAAGYRIKTTMSVDCLAYLTRLMVEANLIELGVKPELLRFIAASFETPGMGANGISPGSLGTKYQQVVQRTVIKLRAALKRMLKQLDGGFGFG